MNLAALSLVLLAVGAPLAAAQSQVEGEALRMSTQEKWTLDERGREFLHDGIPIELIGNKAGDAGLRVRTPILAQSNQAVVQVDPEANYLRRLAMFEEGARFHSPPALAATSASSGSPTTTRSGGTRITSATEGTAVTPEESSEFDFYLNCVLAGIVLILGVHLIRN